MAERCGSDGANDDRDGAAMKHDDMTYNICECGCGCVMQTAGVSHEAGGGADRYGPCACVAGDNTRWHVDMCGASRCGGAGR